jgi:hypothetical protein
MSDLTHENRFLPEMRAAMTYLHMDSCCHVGLLLAVVMLRPSSGEKKKKKQRQNSPSGPSRMERRFRFRFIPRLIQMLVDIVKYWPKHAYHTDGGGGGGIDQLSSFIEGKMYIRFLQEEQNVVWSPTASDLLPCVECGWAV